MISITFALAPAGVLGSGSAAARPRACAVVRPSELPPVAVVGGTGVPFAGMAGRRGVDLLAGTVAAFPATAPRITALPITVLSNGKHDPIQNDGTTPLGIHPRGRSTS